MSFHDDEPTQVLSPGPRSRPVAAPVPARPWFASRGAMIGGAVGVVALAGLLLTRSSHEAPVNEHSSEVAGATAPSSLPADDPQWKALKLTPASPAVPHWSEPVSARFRIDESKAARVHAPLSGRVTRVLVELGDSVKPGDPLVTLSSPDIAGMRAEREKASVDIELARKTLDRVKTMVDAKAAAEKEKIDADQQYRQASVALRAAQAKLGSLKVSGGDNEFTIVAPREGVVVEKNVLPSQIVQPDAALIALADVSTVWVVADIFEADAAGIEAGTKARVTSSSIPDLDIQATVERVSAVVDPTKHTVAIRVALPNPDKRLRPNLTASMRFELPPPPACVEVASSAIVSDGAKSYVFVRTDGRFLRRPVVVGPPRDGKSPVLSGLAAGDIVVEEGSVLLENQIAH
jgi:membrane fusion protein, heavy metal efflux system